MSQTQLLIKQQKCEQCKHGSAVHLRHVNQLKKPKTRSSAAKNEDVTRRRSYRNTAAATADCDTITSVHCQKNKHL